VIVFILIFAMTGKNTMENSKKANGMQKYGFSPMCSVCGRRQRRKRRETNKM
jgi:hypothetical protein